MNGQRLSRSDRSRRCELSRCRLRSRSDVNHLVFGRIVGIDLQRLLDGRLLAGDGQLAQRNDLDLLALGRL